MPSNFKALLGLLIVVAGFAYYITQSGNNSATLSQYLMPEWQQNQQLVAEIDKIELHKNQEVIVLTKSEDGWHVNDGFFVDLAPLSGLLQSLKAAEMVEAKTQNPDNHAQLELSGDDLQVVLYRGEQILEAVHIGKKTSSDEVFVRQAGENQTFTVKNLKVPPFNQNSWLLSTVLDYAASDVVGVEFTPAEGGGFAIARNLETGVFEVVNIPDSYELKTDDPLDNLAAGLTRLMIDEAQPVDLTDKELQSTNVYQLADGSEVVVRLYQSEDEYFLTLSGTHLKKFDSWMMKIAAYKFNALNKSLEDLAELKSSGEITAEPAEL